MYIINSIAPIFLLIALGKLLRTSGFLPESFFRQINRLVFWVALPALLVDHIGQARLDPGAIARIVLLLAAATLLSLGLAWWVSRRLKLPDPAAGAFIQGSFRSNGAFIGLPVIIYALGSRDPQAEALATVVLAPLVILFNLLGVAVLARHGHGGKKVTAPGILLELAKNPLIAACAAGLAVNLLHIGLPLFLARSLDALGSAALPLILMSIGSSLAIERLRGAASPSLLASLLKTVATPAIGLALAALFHLAGTERMITVLYLAAPAAGMSYVMAEVMGNDGPLAGRIVALSTLISALTLPIFIAIGS